MTELSLSGSPAPAAIRRLSQSKQLVVARYRADRQPSTLLRGQDAKLANEWPDPSYWTAYDCLAIEREAQALRRAHAYALIAGVWQRLKRALSPRT